MAETEGLTDRVIDDRFHLTEVITVRTPRTIYAAKDLVDGTTVAVKFFPASDTPQADNEKQILRELQHPHIVSIKAGGTHESKPYIAMERVATSLDKETGVPMNPERAAGIIGEILDGIDYAHRKDIIHGDIKPSNILLTDKDKAKIADWEHAKKRFAPQRPRPLSLLYAAPEQSRGMVGPQSDVYSAGVVAYELLTGKKPYPFDPEHPTIYRGRRPSDLGLHRSYRAVILAALEVNPLSRPSLYEYKAAMGKDVTRKRI